MTICRETWEQETRAHLLKLDLTILERKLHGVQSRPLNIIVIIRRTANTLIEEIEQATHLYKPFKISLIE